MPMRRLLGGRHPKAIQARLGPDLRRCDSKACICMLLWDIFCARLRSKSRGDPCPQMYSSSLERTCSSQRARDTLRCRKEAERHAEL